MGASQPDITAVANGKEIPGQLYWTQSGIWPFRSVQVGYFLFRSERFSTVPIPIILNFKTFHSNFRNTFLAFMLPNTFLRIRHFCTIKDWIESYVVVFQPTFISTYTVYGFGKSTLTLQYVEIQIQCYYLLCNYVGNHYSISFLFRVWNHNEESGFSQVLHLDVPRSILPGTERGLLLLAGGLALPSYLPLYYPYPVGSSTLTRAAPAIRSLPQALTEYTR